MALVIKYMTLLKVVSVFIKSLNIWLVCVCVWESVQLIELERSLKQIKLIWVQFQQLQFVFPIPELQEQVSLYLLLFLQGSRALIVYMKWFSEKS